MTSNGRVLMIAARESDLPRRRGEAPRTVEQNEPTGTQMAFARLRCRDCLASLGEPGRFPSSRLRLASVRPTSIVEPTKLGAVVRERPRLRGRRDLLT
jgi:hypothetical protein